MAANTPLRMPGTLRMQEVVSAGVVRAPTWQPVAEATNFLNGATCRALIPHCCVRNTDGGSYTLRFKVWPSYQATHRLWLIGLSSTNVESFTFTDPSGGTTSIATRIDNFVFQHIETVSSRTDAESVFSLPFTSTDDVQIRTIACFEIVRPSLALDTNDHGVEVDSFRGAAPIYDATGYSMGGIPEAITEALGMRRTLFQWAAAGTFDALQSSGSGVTTLLAYDIPLLDRQIYRSETQVAVTVWIYTKSSASTTGTVSLTMTSGGTLAIAVTAGDTGTWRSGTISVDAENLAASDGRRSSRFDQCTITSQRTSGAGTIDVYSIGVVGRAG